MHLRFLYETRILRKPDDGGGSGGDAGDGDDNGDEKTVDTGPGDKGSILNLAGDDTAEGGDDTAKGEGDDTIEGGDDTLKGEGGDDDGKPVALKFAEKPDWLAEPFYDKETGEVKVEALAKSQADLRAQLGANNKAPEKADDYKFTYSGEGVDPEFAAAAERILIDGDDDPILTWFRGAAHAEGLPQDAAHRLFEGFVKVGNELMPEIPDPAAELDKLGKNGTGMKAAFEGLFIKLGDEGVLNTDELQAVENWFLTAHDMTAFQKLRAWYQDEEIPHVPSDPSSAKSKEELKTEQGALTKKFNDREITEAEYNNKMAALQAEYEKTYGTAAAGTSR